MLDDLSILWEENAMRRYGAIGFDGKAEYPQIFIVVFGEGMKTELLILRDDF